PKAGLSIHWLIYGDSGHKNKTDGLIIERFTKHSTKQFERNSFYKSIVNPRLVFKMWVHSAIYLGNFVAINEKKQKVKRNAQSKPVCCDKIRINHYWGKSYEEFLTKQKRGYPEDKENISSIIDSAFVYNNRNDIEDNITMQKYIKPIKENLKKRKLL
ncbi:MAG: hypothetical protein K2M23_02590, partial [Alphaproteobacteria bacterium]|nr:hypothetical protein [Alphaproteobacteria bacterium]